MAPGPRYGKLARARIVPPRQLSILEEPATAVQRVLEPGLTTTRYGRTWHLGRTELRDGFLFGRLGFESTERADLWDSHDLDFRIDANVPGGVAAPFAIRLEDLEVLFQTRGQDIKVNSFTGALRSMLRDATDEDWRVETAYQRMSFAEWRRSVVRVRRLRIHAEPPNPNYEGRPDVERLIADARLAKATLDLRSENMETDADFVRQLLEHVERGYGESMAVGDREHDGVMEETVYDSGLEGESKVVQRPVDPETGEVSQATLREELSPPEDAV